MKLFKRKQGQNTTTPSELQDYYQSERRERKSVAWLLAFVTFFVTLVFVLLLFFAGKWLYQRFRKNTNKSQTTSQTQNKPADNGGKSKPNDAATSPSDGSSGQPNGNSSTQGAQTAPPQTSSTSTSVPSSSTAANSQLPRTGPDEDL